MNLSVSTLLSMLNNTGYRVTHRENNITGVKTFIIIFNPYRELMFHMCIITHILKNSTLKNLK